MPEVGEVRIFVDQLEKEFKGQSLLNIEVVGGRFLKKPISDLEKLEFPLNNVSFNAKGKFIYWTFDQDKVFFITLGMAASFGPHSKHSALKFCFENGDIFFNDIRHFGTFKISDNNGLSEKLNSLGWDILKEEIPNSIINRVRNFNRNKTVAEMLMSQKLTSGVGNYLKAESCYDAKILPTRLVGSLSDAEIISLYTSLKRTAINAYTEGGATISTFADMYGNTGKFFDKFKVYGKKKDPAGNDVTRVTTPDGRSTYYVENIQK